MSTVLGLFLLSSLSLATGCGAFGHTYSLTGLTIEPAAGDTCIYPGSTAQYEAYGTYTEGGHAAETEVLTDQVQWSVTFPELASINSSGLLTAGTVAIGTSNLEATTQGEFGVLVATSNIQVANPCGSSSSSFSPRLPSSLSIVPGSATLTSPGDTEQPLAIGIYPGGRGSADLSREVTWESSDTSVATVNAHGIITSVGPGKAVITARMTTPNGPVITGTQTVEVSGGSQNQ
ncbi:MAG TPA: Ig-like domain-containing protein [Acidobacteriaceae bacterium]|nr:Ig-like domain-containing protein [Acidobacteriaceae bacterium]